MSFADLVLIDHGTGLPADEFRRFSYVLGDQLRDHVGIHYGRYVVPWVGAASGKFSARTWKLHFWKSPKAAQAQGALGYHETEGDDHIPVGYVFTDLIKRHNEDWRVIASHEACEMVANEWINLEVARRGEDGKWELWPREICDAVQGLSYELDGIPVSNFVTPEWFIDGSDGPYDHMRKLTKPFEIHESGYAAIRRVIGGKVTSRNLYGATYPSWRQRSRELSRRSRMVSLDCPR